MWNPKAGRAVRGGRLVYAVLLGLILIGVALMPCGAASQVIEIDQSFTVEDTGQAKMTVAYRIPTQSYNRLKMNYGNNLYLLFTNLTSPKASWEIPKETLKISADDVRCCINVEATLIGYAVCRRNRWEIPIGADERIRTQSANFVLTQSTDIVDYDTILNINTTYTLPPNAKDISRDSTRNLLTFTLPHTRVTSGTATAQVDLRFKPEIMSAVYKIYSSPTFNNGEYWVAKAIFRNTGKVPIYDLKFYYKLGEFSDEETTDNRYNVVMPGGAVVDLFYPDLYDEKMVKLRNLTPARLYVKYEYTDPNGKVVTEDMQERLEIYGINQFCWSGLTPEERNFGTWFERFNNAPLVAALVTKNDPVIGQFVGMIAQTAKGAPANSTDDAALFWLKAAYDMMWYNNIVYQTPSGFLTDKAESVQEIKFPRDVLINKAGTCVDLAIFYATVAEATGLDANIMVIPGHAFAVITLPSGNPMPIENTLIAGGRSGHGTFEQAVASGLKTFQESVAKGAYIFVPVHNLLAAGVPNPELPEVSPTLLKDLGYTAAIGGGGGTVTPSDSHQTTGRNATIFSDDFSSSMNGWYLDNSNKEGAFITGGVYEVRVSRKTFSSFSAPVKGTIPPDYLVQVDAQVNNAKGYYGLLFNLDSWDTLYYNFVIDPSTRSFGAYKTERRNTRTFIKWTSSNLIKATGVNNLAVQVRGNKAAFYINGKEAHSGWITLDETVEKPQVGVMAGNWGGLFTISAFFDNFRVVSYPQ